MRSDDGNNVDAPLSIVKENEKLIESADKERDSYRLGSSPLIVSEPAIN